MDPHQKVEFLERSLDRLLGWIAAADAKLSTFFAIDTAMLAVLASLLPRPNCWTLLSGVSAALSGALLITSLGMLAAAAFPRTAGPKRSLVYFGGISDREFGQYWTDVDQITVPRYLNDLAQQCHRNAQIARSKYEWVRRAALALFLGVWPWLVAVFELYRSLPVEAPK